jgi:L-ornithine Nalpha-acyltransferase
MAIETDEETLLSVHGRFAAKIALTELEAGAAMRLRFEAFNKELREGLQESYLTGMDRDRYDEHCTHLIVYDMSNGMVVGTYRLMSGSVAQRTVGYYSETEFDLSGIKRIPGEKLELGRSRVHRDYRNSAVLGLLWKGIAAYVEKHRVIHLFGCASLHTYDPAEVSMVYGYLNLFHRAEVHYNVRRRSRQSRL